MLQAAQIRICNSFKNSYFLETGKIPFVVKGRDQVQVQKHFILMAPSEELNVLENFAKKC